MYHEWDFTANRRSYRESDVPYSSAHHTQLERTDQTRHGGTVGKDVGHPLATTDLFIQSPDAIRRARRFRQRQHHCGIAKAALLDGNRGVYTRKRMRREGGALEQLAARSRARGPYPRRNGTDLIPRPSPRGRRMFRWRAGEERPLASLNVDCCKGLGTRTDGCVTSAARYERGRVDQSRYESLVQPRRDIPVSDQLAVVGSYGVL